MNMTLDDGSTELWQWNAVGCGSNDIMIEDEWA